VNQNNIVLHPNFKLNGLHYDSVQDLIQFTRVLDYEGDEHEKQISSFIQEWFNESPFIEVSSSGTTGSPKNIVLFKKGMAASAIATGKYFNLQAKTTALLCLPAKFIAGKMMLVRAMVLGWDLHVVAPEKDALTQYDNKYDFVAMVPYQVHHSLGALNKVKKLIVGGGAISKELEEQLQNVSTEVYATYGMTETATHIAVRCINGKSKSDIFTALPHVSLSCDERQCLTINVPNITSKPVQTNDVVSLYSDTTFKWLGRYDNLINSGGVKLNPERIEEKLSSKIKWPFIIASEPDSALGERVILVIEGEDESVMDDTYTSYFEVLEAYERPKKIYAVSRFPYTDTGKIKKKDILQVIRKHNQ